MTRATNPHLLMQFIGSPILGSLSDRYGRRRIILIATAGSAIDYFVMANAPPSLCPSQRATVGISTPDSMQRVANRWRRSWWRGRFDNPVLCIHKKSWFG